MKTLFTYNNKKYELDEYGRIFEATGNIKTLVVYSDKGLEEKVRSLGYTGRLFGKDNTIDGGFHNGITTKN